MLTTILVVLILIALAYWVVTTLPLPEPVRKVAIVIMVIAAVLYLLKFVGIVLP